MKYRYIKSYDTKIDKTIHILEILITDDDELNKCKNENYLFDFIHFIFKQETELQDIFEPFIYKLTTDININQILKHIDNSEVMLIGNNLTSIVIKHEPSNLDLEDLFTMYTENIFENKKKTKNKKQNNNQKYNLNWINDIEKWMNMN